MSPVTVLIEAIEAWEDRCDVERCQAVEVAARELGGRLGLSVSELLEAVAGARQAGASIAQAVHGVATTRVAA